MSVTTSALSPGVRLIISRRRRGLTQAQEAKRRKASLYQYRGWEEDRGEVPEEKIGRLEVHEQCYVRRIAKGLTLDEVAKDVGVSRWWLRQMERGTANVERLRKYWRV
jgi:transcriptional regulator with XRE-family HTH domain